MKKRLLITSIVMMLVVAVALSTATYAWFTSNASVTANTITLTASSSDGVALGISWGTSGTVGTSISAYGGGTLKPIMPETLTQNTTLAGVSFSGGSTYSKDGVITFNTPVYTGASASAYYYKQAADGTDIIKLTNLSAAGGKPIASVTITPTIEPVYTASTAEELAVAGYTYYDGDKEVITTTVGSAVGTAGYKAKDATDLVRIGVFYSADNTTYTLLEVLAKNSSADGTVFGVATAEKAVGTGNEASEAKSGVCIQGIYDAAQTTTLPVTSSVAIPANSSVYVKLVMWLDGQTFTDAYATFDANVSIAFTAA